jgi:hypothetical protein
MEKINAEKVGRFHHPQHQRNRYGNINEEIAFDKK